MLRRLTGKTRFANALALTAVFVTLGGGAYAARQIGGNQIRNNSITGKDVREKTLKPVCPAAARGLAAGVCFGPLKAADDWDLAARACAQSKVRLPSTGELLLVTNKVTSPYLWTDEVADGANDRIIVRTDDAGFTRIAKIAKSTPQPYRCVTTPR